jgi:hypothetical protein
MIAYKNLFMIAEDDKTGENGRNIFKKGKKYVAPMALQNHRELTGQWPE